jgi:hypothetical protein
MRTKNINLLAICLVLLCCFIGAASAAEDISTDAVGGSVDDAVAVDAVSDDMGDSVTAEPIVDDTFAEEINEETISIEKGQTYP